MSFEFDIRKTSRGLAPRVLFKTIAKRILGNTYSLSLVLCGDSLARALNKKYRKKGYSPNVLSFPLGKREGEIILNLKKTAREAKMYKTSVDKRSAFLFIHACLHLRGLDHGKKMDTLEQTFLKRAGF